MTDWSGVLRALSSRHDLESDDAAWAMTQIMSGEASSAQIAGFAMALRTKGETVHEISGLVEAVMANAVRVPLHEPAVDVVGTGGDGAHTVNVSTMASLVVLGAGVPVLKHGNRAISSRAGTADTLEALGVRIDIPTDRVGTCLAEAGMAFCFAPAHHPGFRHAGPVRKELGVPTVFNVLGPLCNPGQPPAALIGCSDARLAPVLADVQRDRGFSAIVVRSEQGLDEISTEGITHVWDATTHEVRHELFQAEHLGLMPASLSDLRGGEAVENAAVVRSVLAGDRTGRLAAIRDVVLVNAAAALVAIDATRETHAYGSPQNSFAARMELAISDAAKSIDSGSAETALANFVEVSQRLADVGA